MTIADSEQVFILGHRGFRGRLENTLPAFRRALQYADGIEFDVRLTGDGKLVTHHDAAFSSGGSSHRLQELTLREIRKLHPLGRLIPRVEEVLDAFPGAVFNADVKESEAVEPVLRAVERKGRVESTVFSSDDPAVVSLLMRECPDCKAGFSITGYPSAVVLPRLRCIYSVHVPIDVVTYIGYRNLIVLLRALRRRGLRIYLWNYKMNELIWIPRLLSLADTVISDDPARLRKGFYGEGVFSWGDSNVGKG
ncbi:glycerophosphodiester phosphodiesterase family protein [Thermococcus sp. MV11]|uniref:glycerophosphodiester phosphodiesterase family protein n=1 Tax=Thermococcus sp. MV11 TaxID=1638267 RepID=UPI00143040B7|nr:glycerophosphodiester phosphodiesterase family protein [Thermococcus sp. MV11]NJE03452.1 glycerophosphodiester phosphodiesterase [Thermococcus sp. MV11]